jgi:hypothetical protein
MGQFETNPQKNKLERTCHMHYGLHCEFQNVMSKIRLNIKTCVHN